jgi:transcription antitermination factor NusG
VAKLHKSTEVSGTAQMALVASNAEIQPALHSGISSACWYVAYTCPRHEKRVAQQLQDRGIPSFLPVYRSIRRWKDRRKELELPLFPGYCFVQTDLEHKARLLQLPGVVNLLMFQGKPAPVSSQEMGSLYRSLQGASVQPHPYLKAGKRVRVKRGPMAGLEGVFVRWRDRSRIVISITLIQRSIAVEVDEADTEVIF